LVVKRSRLMPAHRRGSAHDLRRTGRPRKCTAGEHPAHPCAGCSRSSGRVQWRQPPRHSTRFGSARNGFGSKIPRIPGRQPSRDPSAPARESRPARPDTPSPPCRPSRTACARRSLATPPSRAESPVADSRTALPCPWVCPTTRTGGGSKWLPMAPSTLQPPIVPHRYRCRGGWRLRAARWLKFSRPQLPPLRLPATVTEHVDAPENPRHRPLGDLRGPTSWPPTKTSPEAIAGRGAHGKRLCPDLLRDTQQRTAGRGGVASSH
jgi:hypothetical protein